MARPRTRRSGGLTPPGFAPAVCQPGIVSAWWTWWTRRFSARPPPGLVARPGSAPPGKGRVAPRPGGLGRPASRHADERSAGCGVVTAAASGSAPPGWLTLVGRQVTQACTTSFSASRMNSCPGVVTGKAGISKITPSGTHPVYITRWDRQPSPPWRFSPPGLGDRGAPILSAAADEGDDATRPAWRIDCPRFCPGVVG